MPLALYITDEQIGPNVQKEIANEDYTVFSNPSKGKTAIRTTINSISKIRIIDLANAEYFSNSYQNAKQVSLHLNELSKGIYLITITNDEGKSYQEKLVIQ